LGKLFGQEKDQKVTYSQSRSQTMKKWKLKAETSDNIIDTILENRGLTTSEQKQKFLNPPKLSELISQFSREFKDSIISARNLIKEHISLGRPILIYGDYDADGVCSTAILFNTIKDELNYDCGFFIPNRFEHGYGLSKKAVDEVCAGKKDLLIITVDTGITAVEEIDYIKSLGHRVIVTDHHQKPDQLPRADIVVWNDQMVASSISWILAKSLGSKNAQSLALAAIATVTDLQPLLDFNRTLVKEGLRLLNLNPPAGIKKLIEVSGKRDKEITAYDLGFVIGPRLNASGRMQNASDSLELLLEKEIDRIAEIAQNLHVTNTVRQDKTLEMYELAAQNHSGEVPKIIISQSEEYHEGIIGLVASRLVQKYYRPVIVISLADGFGKGSVRSVEGVDIISLLRRFEHLFENLGGHKMAAGFTISKENITALEAGLSEAAEEFITNEMLEPVLNVDIKILLDAVSMDLASALEQLRPFGVGNPEPVFMSERVGIAAANVVGRDSAHVSFRFYSEAGNFKGILFGADDFAKNLHIGDFVDIVYNVKIAEFNGSRSVELNLKDIKHESKV
jgi:single-stranded-DNA-specific exonuclease